MIESTTMKSWLRFWALTVLLWMLASYRSPSFVASRLLHFGAQRRSFMRGVWDSALHRLRPFIAVLLLCSMLPWSLGGCVRHAELPYGVPRATVCINPPTVHPDAEIFAYHSASNTWEFEDEDDIEDFEEFARYANIIFLRDSSAPSESVAAFPIPYNMLSCDGLHPLIPRVVYSGQRLPNANELPLAQAGRVHMNTTIEEASALSRRFFGLPNAPLKKGPEIIPVCIRPLDVRSDVKEWLFTTEKVGASYTTDADLYARLRANAKRVYVFDPNAPAESVLRFAAPYNRLRCPGKPLPGEMPDKSAEKKAAFDALVAAVMAKASVSEFGGNGGSDKRTWTSSPDGQGAGLSFFESVVRQMVIAGAFQSGDVSGDLKDPNGSRYGIANGKNVGGPNSLLLQLTAGTFMVLTTPLRSTAGLIKKVASGLKRGGVLIITDVKLFPKKIAEKMIETYGQTMAPSLHQAQTILPYSRASMFTKGWAYLYQSHHILEVAMARDVLKISNFDDLPAIILNAEKHQLITNKLNAVRKKMTGGKRDPSPEELSAIYKIAYEDHPEWLKAIETFFAH